MISDGLSSERSGGSRCLIKSIPDESGIIERAQLGWSLPDEFFDMMNK